MLILNLSLDKDTENKIRIQSAISLLIAYLVALNTVIVSVNKKIMEIFAAREEYNMISYETTTTQQGIKCFENNIEFLEVRQS
ncbi:hypothetical protein [Psychrobacillus lasiicapitis]|uniref:hypothetical protein n=1 Tax=Psychrobacillus lasiicapitis TaxID=1636719 RepID=UPI00199845E1|nr:hypothetical protein [Psychrobacillus lasiicapitis]GGA24921.1 hypothetical protein GCM10011384_12610 [Psychrobacillus lasiicapitis]